MRKFKKKKNKFLYSPIVLLVLFGLLVLLGFKIWDLVEKHQQTTLFRKIAEEEFDNLSKRAEDLNQNISDLNTEEGKEGIIRVKYQVAKEGEKVLSIIGEEEEAQTEEIEKGNKSFVDKIKSFFIN